MLRKKNINDKMKMILSLKTKGHDKDQSTRLLTIGHSNDNLTNMISYYEMQYNHKEIMEILFISVLGGK